MKEICALKGVNLCMKIKGGSGKVCSLQLETKWNSAMVCSVSLFLPRPPSIWPQSDSIISEMKISEVFLHMRWQSEGRASGRLFVLETRYRASCFSPLLAVVNFFARLFCKLTATSNKTKKKIRPTSDWLQRRVFCLLILSAFSFSR